MAVENDEIDEAVVPIENSLEGAVSTTMDMLVTKKTKELLQHNFLNNFFLSQSKQSLS